MTKSIGFDPPLISLFFLLQSRLAIFQLAEVTATVRLIFLTRKELLVSYSKSVTYDVDTSGLATAFSQSQTVEKAVVVVANEPVSIIYS